MIITALHDPRAAAHRALQLGGGATRAPGSALSARRGGRGRGSRAERCPAPSERPTRRGEGGGGRASGSTGGGDWRGGGPGAPPPLQPRPPAPGAPVTETHARQRPRARTAGCTAAHVRTPARPWLPAGGLALRELGSRTLSRGFCEEGPTSFFQEGSESSSHPDGGGNPRIWGFSPPPPPRGSQICFLGICKPPETLSGFVAKIQAPGMRYHSFHCINSCVTPPPAAKTIKMDG